MGSHVCSHECYMHYKLWNFMLREGSSWGSTQNPRNISTGSYWMRPLFPKKDASLMKGSGTKITRDGRGSMTNERKR